MSSSEDNAMGAVPDIDDDDLFGDDDNEAPAEARVLSDRELDSGDDEDGDERAAKADSEPMDYESGRENRILDSTIWRHPIPKPIDGEVS